MKKILGLDLGTTSIGWAMVNRAENDNEASSIIACGSRVVPLTTDEKDNFEKGKAITTNADRRLKRSLRRNVQRRKLRRDTLVDLFLEGRWINSREELVESGKGSTFETLSLRAKAVTEEISLPELARVILSINNKRGYKSSRKVDSGEDGQLVDGMQVAKILHNDGITPAQYSKRLLDEGKRIRPEYYRSDLESEFEAIWAFQQSFFPEILTGDFKKQLSNQGKNGASKFFLGKYGIFTADNKGKDRYEVALNWRIEALNAPLDKERLAYVISDLRGLIQNASGYLGEISDRSKELFFNEETVGQYLYRKLKEDPLYSSRNKVFYRQDYLSEFDRIWATQSIFHKELTQDIKQKIGDRTLFYQRPLKSQKGLISFCEFESHPIQVMVDGKLKTRTSGSRVAPKSSILFQEFKIWQILNNLVVTDRTTEESRSLSLEEKMELAGELSIKAKIKDSEAMKLLGLATRRYDLNYKELEGNNTIAALFDKYIEIINVSGHGEFDPSKMSLREGIELMQDIFPILGCKADLLQFDSSLPKEDYEQQPLFKLWHLLYSYEGDKSNTGKESLYDKIEAITGFEREYARILGAVVFKDDYASLSHKAIRKILPFLKEGHTYDEACSLAGYNHSHSQTAEERDSKDLVENLEQLPKGALRNPVVEKILNQMVNLVNSAKDAYGRPDEIHIELARELKKNAKEREKATSDISANHKRNEQITKILQTQFGIASVRKSDILRYRLYDELKENGYKTLYSNTYISPDRLFSKDIDIEHIIPQALLFDDSFANKTLEFKDINIEKGRKTANDYVKEKYGQEEYERYRLRIDDLLNRGAISPAKRKNLLMTESEIPSGFVDRDLRNSQYIARKAREILSDYVRVIVPTSGAVTQRLREDWQLVDVMKELNFPKYDKAGKTYFQEDSDGREIKRIQDWTKRNDHRHHAMDAITIAFTKQEHINILNNLNSRDDKKSVCYGLIQNEMMMNGDKRIFAPPMPLGEMRREVKRSLEAVLISVKTKNKVVTRNVNKTKSSLGIQRKIELTPRGALHKEQVYGLRKQYEVFEIPINAKLTQELISCICSKKMRNILQERFDAFGGDSKKAFDKKFAANFPAKVKGVRFKTFYSIRKDVSPDLSIDKILDARVRKCIESRIAEFGGDKKAALSNIDTNPIWLDEEMTIPIKRVTIGENFDLCAIRSKRDNRGNIILDKAGDPIPSDYVNLRNNHHVALYKDAGGTIQEVVVPMFEALNRINLGLPAVDKTFHSDLGWRFLFSLKINEMFVFPDEATGFFPKELDLMNPANATKISPHLFRVQKLSSKDYYFRHHQETTIEEDKALQGVTWKRITAIQRMADVVKVRIDHLGRIVSIGEYD